MTKIIDDQELMDAFYEEAQDRIGQMKKDLSTLVVRCVPHGEGRGSSDEIISLPGVQRESSAVLPELLRSAHIIKSSSGSVGFKNLEKISQTLERVFKAAKDEKFEMNAEVISLLSESVEACQKLLDEEKVVGFKNLLGQLNNILHP